MTALDVAAFEFPVLERLLRSSQVKMKLKDLVAGCRGVVLKGPGDVTVAGMSHDSRTTEEGDLFFAVLGTVEDGRIYAAQALEKGAVAVVSESELDLPEAVPLVLVKDVRKAKGRLASFFFGHPSENIGCIGITGTNGKTTTSYMLRSILEQDGLSTGLIGTIQHLIGKKPVRASTTTPDPIEIQRFLAQMVDENQDAAVLEVSSHALDQARVEAVGFRVGVFTNLSQEHLDYHGSMEEYRNAKSRLFSSLDSTARAVVNIDDPTGTFISSRCGCPVLTYGFSPEADFRGKLQRLDIDGFSMVLETPEKEIEITSRLIGKHNVSNALAASAAASAFGVDLPAVKTGIEILAAVPGRVECVDVGQDFRVIVDYAHTDDALHSLLENIRPLTKGRLITLFGCGGDRDAFKRPRMAEAATTFSDLTIVTTDNPRSEDPQKIIDDILAGCRPDAERIVEPDRRKAIEKAVGRARGGDIVVIAGKGHEDYQILNSGVVEFDDRQVVKEVLWKLSR